MNFDIDSQNSKNLLKFLNIVKNQDFVYHLLIMMNSSEIGVKDEYYTNQYEQRIRKIGATRLRSLELLHSILVLLYPTLGPLSSAQHIMSGNEVPSSPHPDIDVSLFVPTAVRRQIVKSLLVVMREFSYCSIANQLCIMVLDQMKTLFDVIDVVQLQKFVINEFRERHQLIYDMHNFNKQNGIEKEIKRYHVDHQNMQSA